MSATPEAGWKRVISGAERKECAAYSTELRRAAESASQAHAQQLRLLAGVTSMVLTDRAGLEPLKPMMSGPNGRTAVPHDLSDSELDELAALLPEVSDAELSARLCDVLWTRRRSPDHARKAVDSYLTAASMLEGSATSWRVRVERALAFAMIIKDRGRGAQVVSYLKARLEDEQPSRVALSALKLLLRCGDADPDRWARRAEAYARQAAGDFFLERDFHAFAADWYRRNNDGEAARRCRIAEAETYVAEAEWASDAETALLMKAHFYQQAIEAFRRVGKCRERIDQLHRRMVEVQERAAATMKSFEGPRVDLTGMALGVIRGLEGCSFPDALLRLATMVRLPSYKETREQAAEMAKEFPLSHLFGRQTVTDKGRVIAKAPGGDLRDSPANERALLASMYEQHENRRRFIVKGIIEPARKKIWLDHGVSEQDFLPFVINNFIVPEGREPLFARALYAGLTGDFVQATHIAIPQIEHAVRILLNRRGVITTGLSDNGLQEENSLGTLLEKIELAEILGEDRVFDMKSLLTERDGANLRNRAAHGLIGHGEFYDEAAKYLWWLTLHFCFLPAIATMAAAEETEPNDAEDTSDEAPLDRE
jgi:hypothetical protein